jgi:hypothetical protein
MTIRNALPASRGSEVGISLVRAIVRQGSRFETYERSG